MLLHVGSHSIRIWTPYLFFVLGKLKNEIQRLLYLVLRIFHNKIKESEMIARKKSLNN